MATYVLKFDDESGSLRGLGQTPSEIEEQMRIALAIKLFEMDRVSIGRASELAGVPLVRFMMKLGELGIPVADLDDDVEIERELGFGQG